MTATMTDAQTDQRTWREIETRRWGTLRYCEEDIIRFPHGILGFENYHRWAIFVSEEHQPFHWMISIDDPDVAFVVIDPLLIVPDYKPSVNRRELDEIEVESEQDVRVFCIVTLGATLETTTMNLSGPLFINIRKKLGKQVVLLSNKYTTKFPLVRGRT